ncbi:MAG: TetR/AcrR family transcriptional regulator C-terminal domain-containing protein [Eggerthellaceae bacterium]|nr:TetR/AcrR family transcriptional regulator C-terminal domain-containing protein [Eggerthellaceae bacterium]
MSVQVAEKTRRAAPVSRREASAPQGAALVKDRRIARTRVALRDALIELVEQQGLDSISVGDLCAAADITRGTFYNHFQDKETLVAAFEDQVIDGLDVFQERMSSLSLVELSKCIALKQPLPLLVEMFDYLRGEGAFLHAMLGGGGDAAFASRIRDSVCTNLIHSILHKRYRESSDPFVGYYVSFYASAYLGVIMRWVETGMQEGSEEMARIAQRLLFIKPGESIKL